MNGTWGSPFVSWGDRMGKKQTDFSYCHMPLLNNQISHPPRNRGCMESHYLRQLRGERQHFFFDFLCKPGRRGVGESTGHTEFCLFVHTSTSPYRYVNDLGKTQMLKSTPLVFHFIISTWGRQRDNVPYNTWFTFN